MSRVLLDPTGELTHANAPRAVRVNGLSSITVALLDIAKPRGDVFLDRVAQLLVDRGVIVERFRKPSYATVAGEDLIASIARRSQAVIEALAD